MYTNLIHQSQEVNELHCINKILLSDLLGGNKLISWPFDTPHCLLKLNDDEQMEKGKMIY